MLKIARHGKRDMIGRGLAWLRVTSRLTKKNSLMDYPMKCEVWGKHLFDPRTGQTAWSNNGALVILIITAII